MHAIRRHRPVLAFSVLVILAASAPGKDVVELYQKASPAVVGIGAWGDLANKNPERTAAAFGTGTFIAPSGLVLTSITVVPEEAKVIRLYLKGGKTIEARRLSSSPDKELVLLQPTVAPSAPFPFLRLGDSSRLRVGQLSYALGNGFHSIEEDDQVSLTAGVISGEYALQEARDESRYLGPAIETTSALNDGMDGGPLLDSSGEVVGVLSLNYSRVRWLGAAIPIDVLKPYLATHLGWFGDRLERLPAYLGLEALPEEVAGAPPAVLASFGSGSPPSPGRPVVSAVEPGSPAELAGIQKGDIIVSIGRDRVGSTGDLRSRLKTVHPGDRLKLGIERAGAQRDVEAVLWGRY
jgi:serine protease Do